MYVQIPHGEKYDKTGQIFEPQIYIVRLHRNAINQAALVAAFKNPAKYQIHPAPPRYRSKVEF